MEFIRNVVDKYEWVLEAVIISTPVEIVEREHK